LDQGRPDVESALTALGSRNRNFETKAHVPPRFKPQFDAANPVNLPATDPRDDAISYIDNQWYGKHRKEPYSELIDDLQGSQRSVAGVLSRPWLNLAHSAMVGAELNTPFFEGGNFIGSDLSFSVMPRASFANANLKGAWLVGASVWSGDFRGANLEAAHLRGANLTGTNFRNAWLAGADFFRSDVYMADLTAAFLVATKMNDLRTMAGARLDMIVGYASDFSD
jgi:hypothetical protein